MGSEIRPNSELVNCKEKANINKLFKKNRNNMLSQPGLPIVLAAVISSILSGTLLIVNNIINNKFQLEREKQQGIRQQESDQKKWYREKIYDSYRTSIDLLKKIIQQDDEIRAYNIAIDCQYGEIDPKINKVYLDFKTEFNIIIVDYPGNDSKDFKEKISIIRNYIEPQPSIALDLITEMMVNDPRIKSINK
jgi:hypothetical protein